MHTKEYFIPSEFAKLFQIDRQTLIYYDNNGIFSPCFKNCNGYRYYSLDQVFLFSELISLKTLSVTGAQLSRYNRHTTGQVLTEILDEKINEYEDRLSRLSMEIKNLKSTKQRINSLKDIPLEQIMLIPRGTIYYQQGSPLSEKDSHLQALMKNPDLVTQYAKGLFKDAMEFSLLPSYQHLDELAGPHKYRLIILSKNKEAFPHPLHFPPALYLTLVTKGRFHKDPKKYISQIKKFMEKLHLKDKKVIFITPFRNTSDENVEESFYVKFELQVEYE